MRSKAISIAFMLCAILDGNVPCLATQMDCTGTDRISSQIWELDLTIIPFSEDSFCVRLPYPDYTWAGRWDRYATDFISIAVTCDDPGPFWYEFHHYNRGYSNQGVWIKVLYPPGDIAFHYRIRQTANLNLPGHDYALLHFTNNGWMTGSNLIDVNAPIVQQTLNLAKQLEGIWHLRGYWKEPEQIVNWMHGHIDWYESNSYALRSASQVLASAHGDCDDWAHAACAMLLKAGIPAKTVLVGGLTGPNATNYVFPEENMHVCLAYWDGFGWILVDPYQASGFTFISRVILGADRDVSTVRIITEPEYLIYSAYAAASCENGSQSGQLSSRGYRCSSYPWEILEHYELPDTQDPQGTEPRSCIIPNEPTAVEFTEPTRKRLLVNYPNPFNPVTTFKFLIDRGGRVKIDVFSVDGRLVANVIDAFIEKGEKQIDWRADHISSGVYIVRFQSPDTVETRKIIVLK